jgi:hypothetical protein
MKLVRPALLAALLLPAGAFLTPATAAKDPTVVPVPVGQTVILDTKSFWRFRTVWETQEIVLPSGEVRHAQTVCKDVYAFFQKNPAAGQVPEASVKYEDLPVVRLPAETPADWMKPAFDDSSWARVRGPTLAASANENWKLILMRGNFEVEDPAKAGDLTLALDFRGGAIVYLNGEEVTRASLPPGPLDLYTPSAAYPDDTYFSTEGFAMTRGDRAPGSKERLEKRIRKIADLKLPAAKLRKGVNVIAIAIHRAPTLGRVYASRNKGGGDFHHDCLWAKIGMLNVCLLAPANAGVKPNSGPLAGRGFKVWNQSIIQSVSLPDYPDPFSPLSPVKLIGVRNGTFAGQVIVGDEKPIKGIAAKVSDLKGPGTIPSANIQVRYAVADGPAAVGTPTFFDSLEDAIPAEVPVYKEHGGAIQPVWITVRVPADAKPGNYSGTVTVTAEGVQPTAIPVALKVIDWQLPNVQDFVSRMDLVQSPESVAVAYDVPLWSDAHMKLLDKTFSLLAPMANKTIFLTCIRRTHFGNEHAVVRWIRGDDGELRPDFSIAEKYLDLAMKHLGKIPGVILDCWEPPESQGHAGGAGTAARTYDKPILITLVDPETGKLARRQGPAWGTPECREFWKKLTDGAHAMLEKRGIGDSMLFGLIGDARPTKQAMDDIGNGVKDPKWAVHSHLFCDRWQGYEIGMGIALWGIGVTPTDPSEGYSFGWSNPMWLSYYPREMKIQTSLVEHRVKLEKWMGGRRSYEPFISVGVGPRGLGRIGADFWPVLKDDRGRMRGSLAGRYPEAAWGQLSLNHCVPYILGRGKNGPLATVRAEAFRESLQEVEARIYIEKALLDDNAKTILGDEFVARCRAQMDARIRMCLNSDGEGEPWYISSDWAARSEQLFTLASEVAAKYGGKHPVPNLSREDKLKKKK